MKKMFLLAALAICAVVTMSESGQSEKIGSINNVSGNGSVLLSEIIPGILKPRPRQPTITFEFNDNIIVEETDLIAA